VHRRHAVLRVVSLLLLTALAAYGVYALRERRAVKWQPPAGSMHRGPLVVRTLGRSGPPIVLLHGFMGSNAYWGAAFDTLAADHRLIVPDLLGFGESPKPPAGYGPDEHADAVAATLQDLGIEEPAVIVAHSFGTLVALRLAVRHPGLVRSVVAFGPPLYPDQQTAHEGIARTGPLGGLLTFESPLARRTCIWFHEHPGVSTALVRLLRPGLPAPVARDTSSHTWESYWGTMSKVILPAEGEEWLREIRIPVRLVLGDRDQITSPHYLKEITQLHPWVSFSLVPGGGHDLPLTHPQQCLEQILQGWGTRQPH
jgi:pimeloyl-ACP methyl ester carboxylesterase